MTEVFIDLDVLDDRPVDTKPVAVQGIRPVRLVALIAVAAMVLGLAGFSLPPRPPIVQLGLFPRPPSDSLGLRLVGDAVIGMSGGNLFAFNLDGTARWAHRPDEPINYLTADFAAGHGVFLVRSMALRAGPSGTMQLTAGSVVALDPATGRPRWRLDGTVRAHGNLLVGVDEAGIRAYQGDPPTLRWQLTGMASTMVEPIGRTAWTLAHDGTLSELDLETGAVRRSREVAAAGELRVFRDRVFIVGGTSVAAYDAQTLQPIEWDSEWVPIDDCGPVYCARRMNPPMGSRRVEPPSDAGIDRRDGRLLWTLRSEQWLWQTEAGLLAVRTGPFGGLAPMDGMLDPLTGRVRVPTDGWQLVTSTASRGIVVRHGQGRVYLGVLRPTGPRALGSVPHLAGGCQAAVEVLMCELTDGNVGVWQLRP